MSRPKSRRDFLLDSGALTHFSQTNVRISVWFEEIHRLYEDPGFFVPYENSWKRSPATLAVTRTCIDCSTASRPTVTAAAS